MRETHLNLEYYKEYIEFLESSITRYEEEFSANPESYKYPVIHAHQMMMYRIRCIISKYSGGYELQEIERDLDGLIHSIVKFTKFDESFDFNVSKSFDDYLVQFWLFSLGMIWRKDALVEVSSKLSNGQSDTLLSMFSKNNQVEDSSDPNIFHARPFEILLAVSNSSASKQIELMTLYLDSWYSSMKNTFWHDDHLQSNGGGHFGYWSWEAAAMVIKFKIDDKSFLDHKYYPADAVAFYRESINKI